AGGVKPEWPLPAVRTGHQVGRVLRRGDGAGNQQSQLDEMTPVECNVLHRLLINHLTEGNRAELDHRRSVGNRDRLFDISSGKLKVLLGRLADLNRERVDDLTLPPFRPDLDSITADRQSYQLIMAVRVRPGRSFEAGCQVTSRDRGAGYDCSLLIQDSSLNRSA